MLKRLLFTGTAVIFLVFILSITAAGQDDADSDITPNGASVTPNDQQILDDLIVDGSLCVGLDCINNEDFSFDTIRLKENNNRIHFQDTSVSASFPTNDWRITINDSSNGGANHFSIDDVTGNSTPFRIMAGGNVGIGTTEPSERLHVNGNIQVEGVVNQVSDRAVKENVTAVSPTTILNQLNQLEISSWSYINDPDTVHIGPMAQDFYAAFGVGTDERHISPLDSNGVALVAIQALSSELEAKDAQIEQLQAENEEIQQRLDELEALVNALANQQADE